MSSHVKQQLVGLRNKVEHGFYTNILKPVFFKYDPEMVHDRMVHFGATVAETSIGRHILSAAFSFQDSRLEQTIVGIHFRNPIGLAAGFDKNAQLPKALSSMGFGFA